MLFLGLLVFPDIFVIASAQTDEGTLLEAHLANAVNQRRVKALDCQIDPAVIVLSPGIVNLLADPEADKVALLGEFEGRRVLVAFGDYHIGCEEF